MEKKKHIDLENDLTEFYSALKFISKNKWYRKRI